jgi:hypothetical protein
MGNNIGSIVKMLLFYGKILGFVFEWVGLMWAIVGWRGRVDERISEMLWFMFAIVGFMLEIIRFVSEIIRFVSEIIRFVSEILRLVFARVGFVCEMLRLMLAIDGVRETKKK